MSLSIREIKKKHEARLMALAGVVSVGIGRTSDRQAAIIIGLDRSRPETEKRLPKKLGGYPVRFEIIGPVKAH